MGKNTRELALNPKAFTIVILAHFSLRDTLKHNVQAFRYTHTITTNFTLAFDNTAHDHKEEKRKRV